MEKRSRRRTRDLVTQPASQGLSQNEIGCVRISMMAKSMNALFTGRIQKRKTNPLHHSHLACNTRPVNTDGSNATDGFCASAADVRCCSKSDHSRRECEMTRGAITGSQRPHSITSSAVASSIGGIVIPSDWAVLRLTDSKYSVGTCTGRSAGFSPLRTRSRYVAASRY